VLAPLAVSTAGTLLGIAAVLSAAGGFVSTIVGLRKSRSEEHSVALEQLSEREDELAKCRSTSEALAKENHKLKMARASEN